MDKEKMISKTETKKELNQKIEILYQVIETISSGSGLEKILKDIVEIIVGITGGNSCFVYLIDDVRDELILRATKNPHPKLLGKVKLKLGEGITGWVANEKKPVNISINAYRDKRFRLFNSMPEDRYESFLSIPIIVKDKVIGVVNVQHRKSYEYSKSLVSFLAAITGQLGSVIENTKLYDELKRKAKQVETLSRVSETVVSDRYLDGILSLIVTVTAEMMDSKICSLMLVDEQKKELVIKATQSLSEEYKKKPNIKIGQSISGQVVKEKKAITVSDVTKDTRFAYPEMARKIGVVSMLAVPMMVKGKVIGVINVYVSHKYSFSREETRILLTVANQSAAAIESSRLMDEMMKTKEALEMRKIIEKAKGVIMKNRSVSEDEAYRIIRKKSMDTCKSMKEIAQAVILASEI